MDLFTSNQLSKLLLNSENDPLCNFPVVRIVLKGTGFSWLISHIESEKPELGFCLRDNLISRPKVGFINLASFRREKEFYELDQAFKATSRIGECFIEATETFEKRNLIGTNPLLALAGKFPLLP